MYFVHVALQMGLLVKTTVTVGAYIGSISSMCESMSHQQGGHREGLPTHLASMLSFCGRHLVKAKFSARVCHCLKEITHSYEDYWKVGSVSEHSIATK